MKRTAVLAGLGLAVLASGAAPAWALDYRSAADVAVLRDAPSAQAAKRYLLPKGSPVELVLVQGDWSKVRDDQGKLSWVESKALSPTRTLLVKADRAQVRGRPEEGAPLVFEAAKNVILEWIEPGQGVAGGWVKVRHRDGAAGYVRITQVWGL